MTAYVRWFKTLSMKDVGLVGGKNASLGEMIQALSKQGITIPNGFAATSQAYREYIRYNDLEESMRDLIAQLRSDDTKTLQKVGKKIRALIAGGQMPTEIEEAILTAYHALCTESDQTNCAVAVRSSATAEDLPTASFAGQQETFLNVRGDKQLIEACKHSMASLFTDRAIIYRIEKGFDHFDVALSVGVQRMIRSDKAASGVAFSLDTETGFKNVIMIDAAYGLGESIVQGLVSPDEFFVFKPTLARGYAPIIQKKLGDKKVKIVYSKQGAKNPVKQVSVDKKNQGQFCLTDDQVLELARMVQKIDDYYSELNQRWTPMDVEWAQDGIDGKLYILQARPETIHGHKQECIYTLHTLLKQPKKEDILVTGLSIGEHIISGRARVVKSVKEIDSVKEGDIIVTEMTDPDWVPVMKRAGGIITDLGGRTCHAAIVSRELATPAIVGAEGATKKIKDGMQITIDCSRGAIGYVYQGIIPFEKEEINCDDVPDIATPLMVNVGAPEVAFSISSLPVDGVGLARIEYIIANSVKVHPMALLEPDKIKASAQKKIEQITAAYPSKKQFFIDMLAQGMATIAAAFYPKPVIVRLSDFKTNEYANLIGGSEFEQKEANPMLGFRGASRYTHPWYQDAFQLEVAAVRAAREKMGLTNIRIMVPFVRTLDEAENVIHLMQEYGLERGVNGLELVMMCEVPSNVLLIEQFARYFDGFSIGSNDLTQLTLGIDRDSAVLSDLFDERDAALKKMYKMAIDGAHAQDRYIGICGQAPSDYPELAQFLIERGIDSISLNADSVIPFLLRYGPKGQ